jgi:hypothetical protein
VLSDNDSGAAQHGSAASGSSAREGDDVAADASGFTGDVLALMSAAASGVYMVLLPATTPDAVHMPSLFGMMGLVCTLALLPLFPLLHYGGIEAFELPPTRSATLSLLVNAATSTVLPDMLLAQAIMMTSPLVATLGLSLMIPLSVFVGFILEIKAEIGPDAAKEREQQQRLQRAAEEGDELSDAHLVLPASCEETPGPRPAAGDPARHRDT